MRRGWRIVRWIGAGISAGLVFTACAEPETSRNLLLVSIDTLRPDHLGVYGYPRPTSPSLDRFSSAAVVFERTYATASWTLPSIASLITSQYPSAHGCLRNRSALPAGFETLASRLATAGFETGAVVSHAFFARRYGLDRGFAAYDDELAFGDPNDTLYAISSPEVTRRGIA